MPWAQELKSLVEEIQSSTADRIKYVRDLKTDMRSFLARVDRELKDMARELRDMAKDLRQFLDKSEATRMEDFKATMQNVQADIKKLQKETGDIQKDARSLINRFQKELKELALDTKQFLSKSEQSRLADFKGMMKQVDSDLTVLCRDTSQMLNRYEKDRHEARTHLAALRRKRGAPHAISPAPKRRSKKTGRPKKKT